MQTEGEQHGHIPFDKLGLNRDAFDTFDANSDGGLDSEELAAVLKDPVPHVELLPQAPKGRRDLVAVLLLRDPALPGDSLDVLSVLVGSGQEEDVVTGQATRARQHVGRDGRVSSEKWA